MEFSLGLLRQTSLGRGSGPCKYSFKLRFTFLKYFREEKLMIVLLYSAVGPRTGEISEMLKYLSAYSSDCACTMYDLYVYGYF